MSRLVVAPPRASSTSPAPPATDTQAGDRTGQLCLVLSPFPSTARAADRRGLRANPPDAPFRNHLGDRASRGGVSSGSGRSGGAPGQVVSLIGPLRDTSATSEPPKLLSLHPRSVFVITNFILGHPLQPPHRTHRHAPPPPRAPLG